MPPINHPIRIGQFEYDLPLDRDSGTAPLYRQIAAAIRERILSGQIGSGLRLPPERTLAAQLGVNRSTIVTAYDELAAEDLISGRVGDGTVVIYRPEARPSGARSIAWSQLFAEGSGDLSPWIREILRTSLREDAIPFAASEPSPAFFPVAELQALVIHVFESVGADSLRYAPTEGIMPLREIVASRLRARGASVSAANVLITAGAQQALDLLGRCFLEAGSEVAVESPTYVGAIQAFRNRSARLVGVPLDEEGMRIDSLEQALSRRPLKFVFTIPNFNNPTGAVLSESRRRRLLELTRRYQVPVIEDDVYGDTWFEAPPPPPLLGRPGSEHAIQIGSLSKALFAGLRIGWIVAPEPVIERLGLIKQIADLFASSFTQWLAVKVFESGLYDRHVEKVRPRYRERRDALIEALQRHATEVIYPNEPSGASFLWCRLARGLGSRELLSQASLQGVTFVPGDVFSPQGEHQDYLRVGFSLLDREGIEEGARRLGLAIDALRHRRRLDATLPAAPPLV
jgi:DNA-binding transcriptional MocR family regulator